MGLIDEDSPVVHDEVGERELMWVEQEGRDTKSENGYPEVDQVRCPERHRDVEQHDQRAHSKIDTGPGKTREEDAE